jgi:hypothetical protein
MAMVNLASSQSALINEFSAANYNHFSFDELGWEDEFEDWVELYNPSGSTMDLSGYWLSDDINEPQKWSFPAGTTLAPQDFLVVVLSGMGDFSPDEYGYLNASFKLKQTAGEDIVFADSDGTVLEYYDFEELGPNRMNHSFARITDGSPEWRICTTPTLGATNAGNFGMSYTSKPEVDQVPGFYTGSLVVTISSTEPNTTIYYTLDGSEPTGDDIEYTGPITIETSTSLRAISYSSELGVMPSFIETNTYLINEGEQTLPVVCISRSDMESGYWGNEEKIGVLELFYKDGNLLSKAHVDTNEHGSDSNALNQRSFDFITQDEMGHDHHVEYPLFHNTVRDEFQRLIFKAGGSDNYPGASESTHMRDVLCHQLSIKAGLDIDARSDAFCVVYINGDYRGLYSMREKVDDLDNFDYYYDQPEGSVDYIKTWGGTWNEYGTYDGWQEVQDYIAENTLCPEDNYGWITDRIEISSFTDFYILNSYVVNQSWLNWDNSWWRGYDPDGGALKWRYSLWDMDYVFWGINFTGNLDTSPTSWPCDFQSLGDPGGAGHVPLMNKLFESPQFESQFAIRYQELADSFFSCEYMNALIDSIENVMLPEIPRHVDRWGGTVEEWQDHIQLTRDFIDQRCDNVISALVNSCWSAIPGGDLNLLLMADGDGSIVANSMTIDIEDLPFLLASDCSYEMNLEAVNGADEFINWEVLSGDLVLDDPLNPIQTFLFDQNIEIIAHFDSPDGVFDHTAPSVNIYPNPTAQQFSIQSDIPISKVEIIDALGKIVLSVPPLEAYDNIDVSSLKTGLYSVKIYQPQGQMTKILYVVD